jgi:hypothetical protein
MKVIIRLSGLTVLNFFVLTNSEYIDIFQLVYDFSKLPLFKTFSIELIYVSISLTISFLALALIEFFKPFIEIYLMFYLKISFYFFINLVSLSTIYIALRIYGYSRANLLLYLLTSTILLFITDKKFK